MTSVLHHRGPDSRGVAEDERCALGNTRLRILDLSDKAALPMSNEDGTVWLCYNGEVTNFRELRAEFRLGPLGPAAEQRTFFRFHSILLKLAGKESQPKLSIKSVR